MSRPGWHAYFMVMAKLAACRSTCNSRPTGAVIVKNHAVLSTGYNGAMPGAPHCTDEPPFPDGSPYCHRRAQGVGDTDKYNVCRASHAEANAIAQAARLGVAIEGATLYTTLAPCYVCLKLLATAGIRAVYYELGYESASPERDRLWREAAREAGLEAFEPVEVLITDFPALALDRPTSARRLEATAP